MYTVALINVFGQVINIPAATAVTVKDLTSASVVGAALATPAAPTLTPSTTGGTLAAGTTYNYRVAAVDADGKQTLAGPQAASNATTTGTTSSIAISWTAVTGAASYNVYGRVAAGELLLANVAGTTYTDTGAITPSGALPAADTTGTYVAVVNGIAQFTMDGLYENETTAVTVGTDYQVQFPALAGYTGTYTFQLQGPTSVCNVLSDAEVTAGPI